MAKVADTETIIRLAELADTQGFNRRLDTEKLRRDLDPVGVHVCYLNVSANDFTIRTEWYLKFRNDDHPHEGTLDIPIGHFNKLAEYVGREVMPEDRVWMVPVKVMIIAPNLEDAFFYIAEALHASPRVEMVGDVEGAEENLEATRELHHGQEET